MTDEIWRDIPGYEGLYQVSNLGRVKSFYKGGRILKPTKVTDGYLQVVLFRDGKRKHYRIHQLVALAFTPNPDEKPEVDHVNNDKTDNRVENLRWATSAENIRYAWNAGLHAALQGEDSPRAKLTNEQARYIRDNPDNLSTYKLAKVFGVCRRTISDIQRNRKYKTAGGKTRESKRQCVSDEVCEQILADHVLGLSTHALSKKYGVSQATVWRIIQREVAGSPVREDIAPSQNRA